jgi:hypothetical protein
MNYAARIVNDRVTQVICGTAGWAVEHLGGHWQDVPDGATVPGIGWGWNGSELNPPVADGTNEGATDSVDSGGL